MQKAMEAEASSQRRSRYNQRSVNEEAEMSSVASYQRGSERGHRKLRRRGISKESVEMRV